MKAKLIKTPEQLYKLKFYNDEDMLSCATALLSKKNCDEIFGIGMDIGNICIECLAEDYSKLTVFFMPDSDEVPTAKQILEYEKISEIAYKDGLIKGLKLNKDKVFTLSNLRKAFNSLENHPNRTFTELVALLQQTEIEVMIVMECDGIQTGLCSEDCDCNVFPKLDSHGCLILTKKI